MGNHHAGSNPAATAITFVITMEDIIFTTHPTELTVTDTDWTEVLSLTKELVPYVHFINYSGEVTSDTVNEVFGVRILYNGNEASIDIKQTLIANQYMKFTDFGMIQPDTIEPIEVTVELRTLNPGVTAKIRKQRLLIMRE